METAGIGDGGSLKLMELEVGRYPGLTRRSVATTCWVAPSERRTAELLSSVVVLEMKLISVRILGCDKGEGSVREDGCGSGVIAVNGRDKNKHR